MPAMKFVFALCALALTQISIAEVSHAEVTPVQKVLQLLDGMLKKGKKEKHEEQTQFASYQQFCDDTTVEKRRAIQEAEEAIDMMTADIQKYSANAEQLSKEISGLDEDLSAWQSDVKAATKDRETEKAEYDEAHKDYTESIDALRVAMQTLEKQSHDRQQASFAQVAALTKLRLIPVDAQRAIDAFLEQDSKNAGGPEVNAYEFQAQGIVDMLENLLGKFTDERLALEKQEMASKHAYDMMMQDLTAQIGQGKEDRDLKAATKSKRLQAKADTAGDLEDTRSSKTEDSKYLSDLTATCHKKTTDFESRQQIRAEEIAAIEKAKEIISSDAVAGNAEKHAVFLQRGLSFGQLRSRSKVQNQERVARYLRLQATKLNSRVLAGLASHVADDPFGKVKKMIQDMITRLMEEANEESEHKGWCDGELSTNEQTRKEKTEAVESLNAEIDQLNASLQELSDDIVELSQAVEELDAAMGKATKLRTEEKATNTKTIAEAQGAQTAVAQAITVLKEFYANAGEATAFVQQPEIFDKKYTGMQSESGGVVGMLEVIEADFSRLESDTKAAEATSLKEYDDFMTDSKVDKAQKSEDIEHMTAKKQDQSQALEEKQSDLEGTQKELDSALAYYDKLKPSCVDAGVSYEDRVSRRQEEMASLQDALKIFNGESI